MSRKLPNCAGCGRPLRTSKARVVMRMTGVKGSPSFGYCWSSDQCGDSVPPVFGPKKAKLSTVMRMIAARGPDRVMLLGKTTLDEACADSDARDAKKAATP